MGNRAAILFGDEKEKEYSGVYLHWNGGPESIYAFTKLLASYSASQSAAYNNHDDPRCSADALVPRFMQMVGNYFNSSGASFNSLYSVRDPGTPENCKIDSEHGVYVIRSDFSIDRYGDDGKKWTDEKKLEEFERVQNHPYWKDEDSIFAGLRSLNDSSFLRKYSNEGIALHDFKEAKLPIEKALEAKKALTAEQSAAPEAAPEPKSAKAMHRAR